MFNDPTDAHVAGPSVPEHIKIRPPSDAENYRIKIGRYRDRWYRDPLPTDDIAYAMSDTDPEAYPSVSIVKGASGKDWTYVALKRVAHADDLVAIASKGFFERYEKLKVVNALDLSEATRRGTNVHAWAECRAYGVPPYLLPTDTGAKWFPTVDRIWSELNPVLVAAEVVCIHRTLNGMGYGGTSDGIFAIDGKHYMIDWKSRGEDVDHDAYPEEAGQIGAYAGCEYIIVADDDPKNPHGAKRMKMPKLDGGLIISIKPDSYEVYPVELPKAIDHFAAMHAWWMARRDEGKTYGPKWPPRRQVTEPVTPPSAADDTELEHDLHRSILYVRHDKLSASQQEQFREAMIGVDAADLDAVERVLDRIENPPTMLEMARERMGNDAEREAARRLSAEGGEPDPSDVRVYEIRWELGMTNRTRKWLGTVVDEAAAAGHSFRTSELLSQRRVNLFCALTEWATCDEWDDHNDEPLLTALFSAVVASGEEGADNSTSVGEIVGRLTTRQAAELRHIVSKIAAGEATYVVEEGVPDRWVVS